MARKYSLRDTKQLIGKNIFVDANVLIYLFWPTGQHTFENNYATAFNLLMKQGNILFFDFLIISEVVNRVLRNEHQKQNPLLNFKEFRNSGNGKDVLHDIYLIVKQVIFGHFKIIGKSFDNNEIQSFLQVDELDFVDKAIVSICRENNLVLLTNDKDFKNSGLEILTGNPRILF